MQKIYLLLRNNKQTGPYSAEELVNFDLKPFDLVWVEGNSASWRYPTEIPALQHLVATPPAVAKQIDPVKPTATPSTPMNAVKREHVFVSMPFSDRPTSVPYTTPPAAVAPPQVHPQPEELKTNISRSVFEAEEAYTDWVFKNRKSARKKGLSIPLNKKTAAAVLGITVLAVSLAFWPEGEETVKAPTPADIPNNTAIAANKEKQGYEEPAVVVAERQTPVTSTPNPATSKAVTVSRKAVARKQPSTTTQKQVIPTEEVAVRTEEPAPVVEEQAKAPEPETPQTEGRKRKSLKEVFGSIFGKKKEGEPKADRESSKRTETATTDISESVSVRAKVPDNSWMMGIQGAQCTLHNGSNAVLQAAEVTVIYYSESKSLIEKKTIQFSKLAPGKSATIAIPDHRMAASVEVKLQSASGIRTF